MSATITCESCGKKYKVKPELAGKKVRCKCGATMRMPAMEDAEPLTYDLTDDLEAPAKPKAQPQPEPRAARASVGSVNCPGCGNDVPANAAICVQCGYNFKTGQALTTSTGGRAIKKAAGARHANYYGVRGGFFDRLSRSWQFAKLSYGILWDFKGLLVFPLFSGVALVLVLASFVLPLWGTGTLDQFAAFLDEDTKAQAGPLVYAIAFAFYFANFFVIVFFNTALAACALKVCAGDAPTIGYGLGIACKRLPQIVGWALLSASVGLLLKVIENAHEKVGRFIVMLLGAAWAVLTYFAVPILAVEGVGPVTALKRSVETLKETWGTAVLGNFSMGVLAFLVSLPLYLLCIGLAVLGIQMQQPILVGVAAGLFLLIVAVVAIASSAADMVFRALLYNYATGATIPEEVDEDLFAAAFAGKE